MYTTTVGVMAIGIIIGMVIIGDHHGVGAGTVGTVQVGAWVGVVGIAHGMEAIMVTTIGMAVITTTTTTITMVADAVLLMVMPETESTIQETVSELPLTTAEETTMLLAQETQTSIRLEIIPILVRLETTLQVQGTTTVHQDQTLAQTLHNQEQT